LTLLDWLDQSGLAPPPEDDAVLQLALPADPASAGEARRALGDYTARQGVPADLANSAVLAISELVTNALRHAGSPVLVLAEYAGGRLTLAVQDGEATLPTMQPPEPDAEGGRSLALVDQLAATWGLQSTVLGKMVWVTLAGSADPPEGRL
jgi:anti-sigma regulatory factor (Ser/Thr protein kinase)